MSRVENDADVHHDVDEYRILADERTQVLPFFAEPQRHGLSRLDEHLIHLRVFGDLVPAMVSREENEAQIVHIPVVLSRLERLGILDRLVQPVFGVLTGLAVDSSIDSAAREPAMEDPHHPRQEAVAPMGPNRPIVLPFPPHRVDGIKAVMALDECLHFIFCKLERAFKDAAVDFRFKLDHGFITPRPSV